MEDNQAHLDAAALHQLATVALDDLIDQERKMKFAPSSVRCAYKAHRAAIDASAKLGHTVRPPPTDRLPDFFAIRQTHANAMMWHRLKARD